MNDNTCSTGLLTVVGVATVMRQLKRICPQLLTFLLEKYSDGFHFIFNVIGFIIVQCLLWFFSNLIYIYSITVLRPGGCVTFKMVKPVLLNNSRMKNRRTFSSYPINDWKLKLTCFNKTSMKNLSLINHNNPVLQALPFILATAEVVLHNWSKLPVFKRRLWKRPILIFLYLWPNL